MKTILHKYFEHILFIFRFVTALPKKKELINARKRITFMIYLKHSFLSHSLGRATELRTNFCAEADSWHVGSRFAASSSPCDSLSVFSSFPFFLLTL